jgi:hypothetical protein
LRRDPHAQITLALAVGEEALGFEHRDLHWGNVLLRAAPSLTTSCRLRGMDVSVQTQVGAPARAEGGAGPEVEGTVKGVWGAFEGRALGRRGTSSPVTP